MKADLLPDRLREALSAMPRLAVAFSGGLDSRFLVHAALLCGCDVLAVHARGPHVPASESSEAEAWLHECGAASLVLRYNPLRLPEVRHNGRQRCYACKKGLLAAISHAIRERGGEPWPFLCDGGQLDDRGSWRPGGRAVAEAGVISPLAEAGLGKEEIRRLARVTCLDRPEQKARPCLLTRLAYGLQPDGKVLERLAACEAALAEALPENADFRLRLAPAPVLQVAGASGVALWPRARQILAAWGFAGATLLECEKVSGFFDADAS